MGTKFKLGRFAVALVFLVGAASSLVVFMQIRDGARDRFALIFQKLAQDRVLAISAGFELHRNELEGFRRFYEQSEAVTDQEFSLYTKPMLVHPCVQSIEWIPRVRQQERAAFEERTGIRIREQDAAGRLVPAGKRAEYFPIELAAPFKLNEAALGFDLGSNPERLAALETAWNQGETSSMELVRLVESPTNTPVFMVVAPVYHRGSESFEERRRNLRGFVLGMYPVETLTCHAMESLSVQGLAFQLEDLDAAPGNRLLYRHEPRIGTFDWNRVPGDRLKHVAPIDGAGRAWQMTVLPNEAFILIHLSLAHRWVLPVGLLISLLVAQLLRMQLLGRLKAELLVQERTVDLRKSEERLRAIYGAADNVALITTDVGGEDSRILSFSPGAEKIFGYAAEEVLGQKISIFHLPETVAEFPAMQQALREGRKGYAGEATLVRKSGECFPVLLTIHPLFNADGELVGTMGVSIDITDRKRAEQLLARQMALLNDTQRLTKVGGWQWNVTKQTMTWTDELYRIHGFSKDEFEPGSPKHIERGLECYGPEDRSIIKAAFERCAADGQPYDLEFPFTAGDGCRKWIRTTGQAAQENGRIVRVFGNVIDITEHRKAEEELRAERDKLEAIFEAMVDGVYIVNQEFDIEYANPVLVAEFGAYEGRKCHAYFHGRDDTCPWCKNTEVFAGKTVQWEWTSSKNGKTYDLLDTPLSNADGSISKLEIFHDITDRIKAEQSMQENAERFRGMFEHMSSGVAIYQAVDDGADFVFVDFNPAGERIENLRREDVVGKRLREAFPAAGEIGIFEVFQRVWRTGKPEHFPVTFYKDDRIEGWRENYIYRLPSGEVVAVYDDLTAQKQAEQEREQAHAFLQTVIDGFPGALMVINLDYTVALANRTAREIGERIGSDTPLLKCHCISHGSLTPCGSNNHPCPMLEVLKTNKAVTLEHIHSDAQGREIPVEVVAAPIFDGNGEVVQIIETSFDITVRKQVEEEKGQLLAAIDQVAESVLITDVEGSIQYANQGFERITGYTRQEVVGRNTGFLESGEHDEAFYRDLQEMIRSGETWSGRFVNRRKNGALYTAEATISPVTDAAGKFVNIVSIEQDITVELARESQLRQSQKMESIGRLAGGVAHDFNNILQAISGFSGLILSEMDAEAAQRQDVLEIQTAVKHAAALTRQLLIFSREQPTEYKRIDLNTVLSGGKKMLRQALDDSFKLRFKPDAGLHPVSADASQILQIAMNLVVNARDAMPEGGTLTLRTQNIGIEEKDLPGWPGSKVGNWVCFSVSDPGCGMDERQLAHLFEPFYTTKQLGKGTGLGLSVVYGIVEEHGGWISVSSEPGKGSVFQVCLPVHDAADSGNGAGAIGFDAFLGKQILLVDDDPVVRELTAEILQDVGYAVTVAADAAGAKQLFSENNGVFDMLFSDVVLPDGNGIELAGFFQERHPGLPVLLFSGHSDERARVDLIQEKGFNYIRKPFNLKKLLGAVERTITDC